MKKSKLLIACLGLCSACSAFAADDGGRVVYQAGASSEPSNAYIGFNLGQSRTSVSAALTTDNDLAYGLLAGYRLNRNFAAEIAYFDLGKIATSSTVSARTTALSVAGLGSFSVSNGVSLFGKFGVAQTKTSWSAAPATGVDASQSKTGLHLGAGLMFDVARNVEVRASYDRILVGSDEPVAGTAAVLSLAGIFRF